MLVHIVSVIYVGSRGLWLTLGVTVLIYIAINFIKFLFSLKFKKTILINLFWIIFTGVILLNLTKTFETQHVIEKVKTLLYIFMHGTSNVDASVSERTFSYLLPAKNSTKSYKYDNWIWAGRIPDVKSL